MLVVIRSAKSTSVLTLRKLDEGTLMPVKGWKSLMKVYCLSFWKKFTVTVAVIQSNRLKLIYKDWL